MKNIIKYPLILCLLALTISCANSAYLTTPTLRFEGPEVSGPTLNGAAGFAYQAPLYIVVSDDVSLDPPSTAGNDVHRDNPGYAYDDGSDIFKHDGLEDNYEFNARLSFFNKFEISFANNLGAIPLMGRIKYQFMGKPISHRANNFVASIYAGYGQASESETFVDRNSVSSKLDLFFEMAEAGLILGYRSHDFVVYVNSYYSKLYSDLRITKDAAAIKYEINGQGEQYGAILGARYDFWFGLYLGAEWAYTNVHYDTVNNREFGTVGATLGYRWGWHQRFKRKKPPPFKGKDHTVNQL